MKIWNASSRIAVFQSSCAFQNGTGSKWKRAAQIQLGWGQMSKTELRFSPCLFLLQLHLLWMFLNHISGHLDQLGLSPRDREIWQQLCPAQSLATPRAGCRTRGFARQGTLGKGLAEEFVTVSVTALLPN